MCVACVPCCCRCLVVDGCALTQGEEFYGGPAPSHWRRRGGPWLLGLRRRRRPNLLTMGLRRAVLVAATVEAS